MKKSGLALRNVGQKTTLWLLLTAFIVVCSAQETGHPVLAQSAETIVFVTKSGTKYHLSNCRSLRTSRFEISLADAVHSGYGPCSICRPPQLPAGESGRSVTPGSGTALYRVNLAEPASCEEVDFSRLLQAEVVDHVDGDTVRVRITNPPEGLSALETIRLIGVDTPETVHPQREIEAFGPEASNFTKQRLLGKTVYLAFDWDMRDRYGRLLAYIYTENRRCHNAEIIREGYGHAYTRFPFRFLEEFRSLEQEARQRKKGLWG